MYNLQIDGVDKFYYSTYPTFTCSKSAMETPEQCVKSVQS